MNNLIKAASHIPVSKATQTISISPITLSVPGRAIPLELRLTAPVSGTALPVILISHGHGPSKYLPSKDGYAPLANFYAEHGFAVIQPTHLNSRVAGLPADAPGGPLFWRSRVEDMTFIIDHLDEIESSAPTFAGRLDKVKVAAVGHSAGGHTVGMLLGARLTDLKNKADTDVYLREPRIKVGVLLGAPGSGGVNGSNLSDMVKENYSFMNGDFADMATQTLVCCGDNDASAHLTNRGAGWHADPYYTSPAGNKSMLTLLGGGHGFGGISSWDAKETDDEDPERLAVVQRMTWAYLQSALNPEDPAWSEACKALENHASTHGKVEHR